MTRRSAGNSGTGAPLHGAAVDADGELFRRTMAGVRPLAKRRQPLAPAHHEALSAKPPPRTGEPRGRPLAAPRNEAPAPPPPRLSADTFNSVDRRTVERLRRGKLPIDARLDLHGNFQDAAVAELNRFIAGSAAAGHRVVLVITGKGSVGEGGGVLRRRLPDWLNLPACRPHVLAFATARPEHGGGGAYYVLLRRRRERRQ